MRLAPQVLGVRARYEKELRVLHEEKNRSEEEIRQQLKEEKVLVLVLEQRTRPGRKSHIRSVFQGRTREMQGLQQQLEDLQQQLQAMEGTRGWFERRLKEAEVGPAPARNRHRQGRLAEPRLDCCLCVSRRTWRRTASGTGRTSRCCRRNTASSCR